VTVTVTVAVLFWIVVVARLRTVRRDARQRMLWAHLLFGALAVTIALPALLAGREVPIAAHVCGVVAAHLLLRFISLVTGAGRPWVQYALALAVLSFLTLGPSRDQAAYWVVFDGYLALVLTLAAKACGRIGRAAPRGLLRVGLLMMSGGLLLIAAYASGIVILALAGARHSPVQPWLVVLRRTGVLLYLAGASVPAAVRLRAVLSTYRSLVILRPLWSAMRRAFPDVVLVAPGRAALEMTGETGVRLRLYRRVIEIRDGMLALREHLPPCPPPGDIDPAVFEARAIAVALQRRAAGEPPADPPGRWAPVGPEMSDEVAWLSAVSRAYQRTVRTGARTPTPAGSPR
jgi:uncharacterized protein DUF6545